MRLEMEYFRPASNKHRSARSLDSKENRNIFTGLRFVTLAFLQQACLLNAEIEYPRSNLVFKQSILRNDFIFGMLYSVWRFHLMPEFSKRCPQKVYHSAFEIKSLAVSVIFK